MIKIFKGMSELPPDTLSERLSEDHRISTSRLKAAQCVPERVCNSTSKTLYTGPAWSAARPGTDAIQHIKSRGF